MTEQARRETSKDWVWLLPRLVSRWLKSRNPFHRFLRGEVTCPKALSRFTDESSMTVPATASVYTQFERGACFRAFTVRRRTSNRL